MSVNAFMSVDIKTFNFSYFIFNSCLIIEDWSKATVGNFLYGNRRTILTLTTYVETLLHWENIEKASNIDLCLLDYLNPSNTMITHGRLTMLFPKKQHICI